MITNASFQDAGASSGAAAGWTMRSACAREAIAAFAPGESVESFERWSVWSGALGAITRAPFAPSGTVETFDAWPVALFAFELTPGLIAAAFVETFDAAWWAGTPAFASSAVPQVASSFAGAPQEMFDAWRAGEVFSVAFAPASLFPAALQEGAVELFDGAAWKTKNTTLG